MSISYGCFKQTKYAEIHNITEKNKKSSVDQKRFYQRKFSGLSGIKLPVGRLFKFLRPPLQRRNSCPVLSISELKSGVKVNGTPDAKTETELTASKVSSNEDVNNQQNLSCRLTKWTSHSELLQSELKHQNISREEIPNNREIGNSSVRNSCLKESGITVREKSGNFTSTLKVKTDNSLEESEKRDYIRNFGTKAYKISQTETTDGFTEPFIVEKTVIIVSENNPEFSYNSNEKLYENHLNSNYISNIDTSISSMNNAFIYLEAQKRNNTSNISNINKKEDDSSIDQVKVINSLPFQSDQDFKIELDHLSHHPHLQASTNAVEVHAERLHENNTVHGSQQKTQENDCYNFNSLEKVESNLKNHSKNNNFCTLKFTQGNVDSNLVSNSSTTISNRETSIENGQLSKLPNSERSIINNSNSEYKANGTLGVLQNKDRINENIYCHHSSDVHRITKHGNENHASHEPIYSVVEKFSSNNTHFLNTSVPDNCNETRADSSYIAETYKISENSTNRTLAYFGCRETVKTSLNTRDEFKINPALYICEVNNSFLIRNNDHDKTSNIYLSNEPNQRSSVQQSNNTANVCTNLENLRVFDQESKTTDQQIRTDNQQLISIIYSPDDKNSSFCEINTPLDSNTKVNTENDVCVKNDVLDFGENSSNSSISDLQNGQINECYNVKLDAPEEVIVAGFHDFCHTMLSLEESNEMQETGTIKRRPGYKNGKSKISTKKNTMNSANSSENLSRNESLNIQTPKLSADVTTTLDYEKQNSIICRTSTTSEEESSSISDKLLEEIQNSKSLGKMSLKDPDVIDAIRTLDNSLMEISESTMEQEADNFSQVNSEIKFSSSENNEKPNIKGPPKISKEDKIQCDNLIEELMLEGISKRVSNIPESSDSSSVLRRGIAVTISNLNTKQISSALRDPQCLVPGKGDSDQMRHAENNDYWLSAKLSNSLKVSSTSDANSCQDDISSDTCASDFCDPEEEMKKVNQISNPTYAFPASIITESPNAVYPLQVSVDHNSSSLLQNGAQGNRTSPCSVDSGTSSHNQGYFVVVAIDFGTTYSGYAFSFTRDPDNIHMMKKWDGGDPGVFNQKTPTTLLLSPEGTFHSFGYSARDYYHDLDEEEAKGWLYFEKFKMTLHHSEHLSLETEIAAANGKRMPAVTVFAHALRYFKDHAIQELSDQSATKILNEDVRWVVTVPAIWKQPAKQFMRAAAYKAGIASPDYPEQLLIALEPEAASIYCRRMRLHQLVPEETHFQRSSFQWQKEREAGSTISDKDFSSCVLPVQVIDGSFTAGTRYMVVDCGGGTVDITVHELLDKQGTLKELQKASGGPYGAIGVDMEFEKLLCDIFGEDFIQQFKSKRPTGYVDLMIAFEARKRNANPYKTNPLNISLPYSFIEFYEKYKGSSAETAIKKSSHKNVKWSSQGMLRLEPSAMEGLFRRTVEKIRQHIENIINQKDIRIDHIFLVGGFAESLILQKEIKDTFSSRLRVIIPQGVSLAILKGAVLFGLDPTTINIRRLRMTYGVGVLNRFIHGVHPREKLVIKDGIQWCADVFDKFVINEQSIDVGDVVVRRYTPAKDGQSCSVIHIYCSEKDNVYFITDPGVKRCATLILDLSDSRFIQGREIQTQMMFGDTEIKVSALDVTTGKCVKAEVDFLNQ
ncbi:heat shock 70 kDa protein 12A [Trichonephila clavata]|uniref:Heat shock 70 kDa protein 12A n=1 Tax=Trichonephila clavata TaxID=2740835 RepID=A0A8X6I1D1_TRICU|nr:heat shock 70 kDa protein 12A [Trichonephila clavata]